MKDHFSFLFAFFSRNTHSTLTRHTISPSVFLSSVTTFNVSPVSCAVRSSTSSITHEHSIFPFAFFRNSAYFLSTVNLHSFFSRYKSIHLGPCSADPQASQRQLFRHMLRLHLSEQLNGLIQMGWRCFWSV
jgi:hypothetical protein